MRADSMPRLKATVGPPSVSDCDLSVTQDAIQRSRRHSENAPILVAFLWPLIWQNRALKKPHLEGSFVCGQSRRPFRQLYSWLRLLIPVSHQPRLAEALRGHFVSIVSVVVQRQHFTRELPKTIQRVGALGVICCPREPVFQFGLRLDFPAVSRGVISNRILCRVGIAQRRKPRPPIIGTKGCMSCGRESVSHTTARRSPRTSAPRTWYCVDADARDPHVRLDAFSGRHESTPHRRSSLGFDGISAFGSSRRGRRSGRFAA